MGISRLPRTITSGIKQTSCGIKRILPDQPDYKCYAMFLDKWALHFNDEEFSQQLSQFSRTDALPKLATFRLKYKDNYEYKFSILNTHFRFGGRNISKCMCSELKTYTCSCLRTPVCQGHYYCGQADPTSQLRQTISTLGSVYPSTVGEG